MRLRVHRVQAASTPPMISPGTPGVYSPAIVEEAVPFLAVLSDVTSVIHVSVVVVNLCSPVNI